MPLAFALAAAATPSIGAAPEYELVFEDEFFGGALDTSAWSVVKVRQEALSTDDIDAADEWINGDAASRAPE